jgi:hypothetical protein
MWGSWFGILVAGVLFVAAVISLIFGTSIAVFGILIAIAIGAAIMVGFGMRRGSQRAERPDAPATVGAQPRNPRSGGAPATGEGAASADGAPSPHEPANTPSQ